MTERREYTCEACKQTFPFPKGWTDEMALAELRANFGDVPPKCRAMVCDDCYNKLRRALKL